MNICFVGTGYVGLVSGTCFADLGNTVICVDNDEGKINSLKNNIIPIYEPGLEEMVIRNIKKGRLSFSTSIAEGVAKSQIIFIAVGTPPKPSGEADLSFIERVSMEIAQAMKEYRVIVEKSTVPVETGEWVARTIKLNNVHNVEFDVVSNPEFLREGSAISDAMNPDRIIVGVSSERAAKIMKELYAPFNAPLIITDIRSAEIIKHASNSFLAMKISFINAVANVCELAGADIEKVAEGMGYDKRIGRAFLNAGIGYGGSCFPKDVQAFLSISRKHGYNFELLEIVENINKQQRKYIINKIEKALWILKDKQVGILGLAFKPNTDDMREAPSVDIIAALQKEGAKILVYDPVAMEKAHQILANVTYCNNAYEAASGSDALVICTEWNEFKELDLEKLKSIMHNPTIIDSRNIYDPARMKELGFSYSSIGRSDI